MPQVNMATMPPDEANRILQQVERLNSTGGGSAAPREDLKLDSPPHLTYELGGWYSRITDGSMQRTFQVRELTGRDEEALARITEVGEMFPTIIERGLTSIGGEAPSKDSPDALLAGDWGTVLLAIRRATFGDIYEMSVKCRTCEADYTHEMDLAEVEIQSVGVEDMSFQVTGKNGAVYETTMLFGAGQRKILTGKKTSAQVTTQVLKECVQSVNGRPVLTDNDVQDLPLVDRRTLMRAIMAREVGPNLKEVTTACPACGAEQRKGLVIADLFR